MNRIFRMGLLVMCLSGVFQIYRVPLLAAAPPAAQSAESSAAPHVSHELLFEAINFILLLGFLIYLYRKRGKTFFDERSEAIQKSLDEGRQALEKSEARLVDAEKKLAGLQDEIKVLRKQADAEIESEQEKMRQAADDEARRIEEFAKARIQSATNAAKLELKDYVVEKALEQARNMIRQRMDETNRERLVSYFLEDLSSKTKSN